MLLQVLGWSSKYSTLHSVNGVSWYILPIGGLYGTYHLLREPETNPSFSNGPRYDSSTRRCCRPRRTGLRWGNGSSKAARCGGAWSPDGGLGVCFSGGVSLKVEKNYRVWTKKSVCLFFREDDLEKILFCFELHECGCLGFVSCPKYKYIYIYIYIYVYSDVECGEGFKQQNTKKLFQSCIMHKKKLKGLEMMASSISKLFPLFSNV